MRCVGALSCGGGEDSEDVHNTAASQAHTRTEGICHETAEDSVGR